MIIIKSDREIALLAEAGRIVGIVHEELAKFIKPGVTTREIDKLAEKVIIDHGATPSFKGLYGFPAAVCTSVNECVIHGIPNNIKLKQGDIVSVDVGACINGYHGDSAWTYAVGEISESAQRLLDVTHDALFKGLAQVKPGNHLGDVSAAIGDYVKANGYTSPVDYTGHGVGRSVHEDPNIPNFGTKGHGPVLKKGMVLAIEPMVHIGKKETVALKDSMWNIVTCDKSLAAHYEHTVAVTSDGYLILTTNKED